MTTDYRTQLGAASLMSQALRAAYDFERTLRQVQATLQTPAPEFRAFLERLTVHRRHHPPQLCIDGHAYRRRRNARRRARR